MSNASKEPLLGLIPRHKWLRERVSDVIKQMQHIESVKDWEEYKRLAVEFSKELNYAASEWCRYYE